MCTSFLPSKYPLRLLPTHFQIQRIPASALSLSVNHFGLGPLRFRLHTILPNNFTPIPLPFLSLPTPSNILPLFSAFFPFPDFFRSKTCCSQPFSTLLLPALTISQSFKCLVPADLTVRIGLDVVGWVVVGGEMSVDRR